MTGKILVALKFYSGKYRMVASIFSGKWNERLFKGYWEK